MAEEEGTQEVTNVVVAVRARPMNKRETEEGATLAVEFHNTEQLSITTSKGEASQFAFDHIFPSTTPQGAVFDKLGVALLDKAFHGFNSTIFAYGQTGSGKTHTMLNHKADADNRGLIPRIADSLYARIAEETAKHETRKFLVCCSFMEIYNEIIFDLLVARKNQPKGGLEVKEQKGLGVYVKDLQEMVIETSEKLQNVLEKGFEHRQTASTKMNDVSSRSHCIFVIKLHQKDTEDGTKNTFSKLNLVDLAGSERQKSTEAEGDRLKEGANINKSLSALGNVINALSSQSQGKKQFVPYRNSKLTRVLQESLGGNSLCTMVAAISPSSTNSEETLSTLNYAKRAKMIKVTATKNDEASQVKKLEEEVMALRRKLEQQASSEGMMSSKDKEEMESKYGAQIDELQSFMKQSWEEKQKLSEKYEEEQRRAAEEKARSAERVRHERARRLQLLEQNGDIELSLKAIASIGSDITKGLLEKIGEALKVQQQMESQLHAVRLYRESAASDFRSCTSCKASDAVALQTLLKQVHAKLGSMTKELDVLVRLESQLDESMGRIAPQVALASRQAEDRAGEGQDDREAAQELAELLGVVQRQLVQRQAGRHSKLAEDLQQLGLLPESQWLMQRLAGEAEEGAAPPTESTLALLSSLKARADGGEELAAPAARSGPTGVLGLSTFETKDELMGGSSNAESARCARLLQTVLFGGWCPETDSPEEYLEIDLGEERLISGMSIQGRMPCTSEWTQTRDLLQLSLSEMADKLPTAEKIFRRPPVRLIHDIGVVMAQERDCFAPWKVPPELLEFGGLSRDQKVAFFQELIDRTNQVGLGGAGMDELKVTPQDILKGNNCEETNRLLQVLAYLGLRAQRLSAGLGSGGGLLDLAPQWIETWRLRVFTEEGGWQWYGAGQEAGGAHVFGGASDAAGTHFVGLPAAVPARRIRVHPVTWHGHAALRCEVHVVLKEGTGSAGAAPAGPGHVRNPSELKGWTSITCDAIVEVQKSIEESRQKKQLEEDEKAAAVLGQKDAAEQERNQLAEQLKSAQQRYEELEAQRLASEQRAVAAETALLQMQVERDRLQSRTEQLETEIVETNEAKRAMDEQCEGLKEQCGELRAEKADLETQLQVMTEERDVARAKEEEYFEYCNSKDEELVDTNNGYVYLTERLQEKEEEMEQLTEEVRKLQEGNEELHDRVQKLASENLDNLGEQQKLRTKLAEEERGHKAAQERYMKLLKSNMGSGDERNSPMTASTDATKVSEDSRGLAEGEKLYEDDFEAE